VRPKAGWTRQPSDEAKLTACRKSPAYVSAPCHEVKREPAKLRPFLGFYQISGGATVLVEASILPGF
jgi:hypothetical protein